MTPTETTAAVFSATTVLGSAVVYSKEILWKCMASGCSIYDQPRSGLNAFKVLHHYCRTSRQGVVACDGDVAPNVNNVMRDLLNRKLNKKEQVIQNKEQLSHGVVDMQNKVLTLSDDGAHKNDEVATVNLLSPGKSPAPAGRGYGAIGPFLVPTKRPPPTNPVCFPPVKKARNGKSQKQLTLWQSR